MEIKYVKSAARLLNRNYVNRRGLDLSKKVLWISVGQWAAELPAIKFGGLKKNCRWARPGACKLGLNRAEWQIFLSPT